MGFDLRPPCAYCKHLVQTGTLQSLTGWTCKAYPLEIPYTILQRYLKHDFETPGQEEGFVYEPETYDFTAGKFQMTFEGNWKPVG